jgi:hypothetical protein
LLVFAELLADRDVQAARARKRFDRLHAPHGRTGQDTRDLVVAEELWEPCSLASAPTIERSQKVIADPIVAVPGRRMADEQIASSRAFERTQDCAIA